MRPKDDLLRIQGDISKTLASKYRPRTFKEIVGQAHAVNILKKSLEDRTVPQQLLFSGGSGLGKTTLARVLGASLLCQSPQGKRDGMNPCLKCTSCLMIFTSKGPHPDLIEFDAASYGGKDEIKEIASKAQLSPMIGPVKVYIIDEAHGLSNAGGQAFLKLLEEPPLHVVFILCTTDPEKMLKTNRGRCVEFELIHPGNVAIKTHLKLICEREEYIYSDDILDTLLTKADPDLGVRGVLMELSKVGSILKETSDTKQAESLVIEILGMASTAKLKNLSSSLEKRNTLDSLDNLNEVLSIAGTKIIKKYLIEFFSQELLKSIHAKESSSWYQYALETLLNCGSSRADLQLSVVKISTLNPTVTPNDVFIKESENILYKILEAIDEAKMVGAKLYEVTSTAKRLEIPNNNIVKKNSNKITESIQKYTPNSENDTPSATSFVTLESKVQEKSTTQDDTRFQKKAVNAKEIAVAESATTEPAKTKPKLNPVTAQLMAAAAPIPAALPSFLNQCNVHKNEKEITIEFPENRIAVFKEYETLLRGACGRLGMVLVVTTT